MFTYRPRIHADRLNDTEVTCARKQRLKEIHMWLIIREVLIYICFLLLLCLVAYSNRDQNSFLQVNHLRKYFLKSDYTKVSSSVVLFSSKKNTPIFIDLDYK